MTFTPHGESAKSSLSKATQPEGVLPITMASTNIENGEIYAVILAATITVLLLAFTAFVAWYERDNVTPILIGAGGFIISIFAYFIFEWLFM